MLFRTEVKPDSMSGAISHDSRIMMLGSCFSDNMASQLKKRLFNVCSNPFGTLFNPASIARSLQRIASGKPFTTDDIFQSGSLFRCYDCHSSLCRASENEMLCELNSTLEEANSFLRKVSDIFLTFGTAWIFELRDTGQIVANCHKQRPDTFTRRMMDVDETEYCIRNSIETIRAVAPAAKIHLTVSPVRHLADGAHGNSLSKATLLLAAERLASCGDAVYFPSYEMLIDDLRDYRFYASDLCHPSEFAVDYIYERFSETFFNRQTIKEASQCEKLFQRLSHRFLTPDAAAIEAFNRSTLQLRDSLLQQYPEINEALSRVEKNIQQ